MYHKYFSIMAGKESEIKEVYLLETDELKEKITGYQDYHTK